MRWQFITQATDNTVDAIHMDYRLLSDRGVYTPPIWSTGRSSRPDADQIQD